MFFKKRREAKKQAKEQMRQAVVDSFAGRIDEAAKAEDPADGVLKLQTIADDIDAAVDELSGKAAKSAKTKSRILFWTAMPAGIAASAIFPPAFLGLLGMGASVYGGNKLSQVFGQYARKKDLTERAPLIAGLEDVKTRVHATQDAIVIKQGDAIAASDKFVEVLAKAPRLREQFAAAYGRKMAEEKEQAQKAAPASKKPFDPPNFGF